MLNWNIDHLRLEIIDASGHEHRISGIAKRATELLGERIDILYGNQRASASRQIGAISAQPVRLDLNRTTDEHAAHSIADAWMAAVAVRLKV